MEYVGYYTGVSNVDTFLYNADGEVWNGVDYVAPDEDNIADYRTTITRDITNSLYIADFPAGAIRYETRLRAATFADSKVVWSDPIGLRIITEDQAGTPIDIFIPEVPPPGMSGVYTQIVNGRGDPQQQYTVTFISVLPPAGDGKLWVPDQVVRTSDAGGNVSISLPALSIWDLDVGVKRFRFTMPAVDTVVELPRMVV